MIPDEPPPVAKPLDKDTEAKINAAIKRLSSRTPADRVQGAEALEQLGMQATTASRALCAAMLDPIPQVRVAASGALEKVNPRLQKAILPIIVDKEFRTRRRAVAKLRSLGKDGLPALPVVLFYHAQVMPQASLSSGGLPEDGAALVQTLFVIGADSDEVWGLLASLLVNDSNAGVRESAAQAMVWMKDQKRAVTALSLALRADRLGSVRALAAEVLGVLGTDLPAPPEAEWKSAIEVLAVALQGNGSESFRAVAARALGRIGPAAKAVKGVLKAAKTDASAKVRAAAEQALMRVDN